MPPIFAAGDFRSAIRLVDLNNDGKLDLIVSNTADANVAVALGNGNGTFRRRQLVTVSNHPLDFDAADLNGDGRLDFFTADGTITPPPSAWDWPTAHSKLCRKPTGRHRSGSARRRAISTAMVKSTWSLPTMADCPC